MEYIDESPVVTFERMRVGPNFSAVLNGLTNSSVQVVGSATAGISL